MRTLKWGCLVDVKYLMYTMMCVLYKVKMKEEIMAGLLISFDMHRIGTPRLAEATNLKGYWYPQPLYSVPLCMFIIYIF